MRKTPSRRILMLALGLLLSLSSAGAMAQGTSATAGLQPMEDSDTSGMAPGRLLDTADKAAPVPAPPFKLTPPSAPALAGEGVFHPKTFTLPNGLAVVLVENHRAPIVSQMLWYRVGGADEPEGKSGLAHLFEHLMFKGTDKVPDGEFSRRVAANGGEDNAFTSWDFTAYFQNIAKDRLEMVMQMEADRMTGLTLTPEQVASEIQVVLAERQQRTENNPADRLMEAMHAALFVHHPYGRPVVGWDDEVKALTHDDAVAFYQTWYSPANAILVVGGDITLEELKPVVERTYGKIKGHPVPKRKRVTEPTIAADRQVQIDDETVTQPLFMRLYKAPSFRMGDKSQILPLELLSEILGGGPTSRLYRRLAVDLRLATSVDFSYDPQAYDLSTAGVSISPVDGADINLVAQSYDAVIKDLITNGISEAELNRAKTRLVTGAMFARDSVQGPAYLFGMTLATGGDISDIEKWPDRVMAVTSEQVVQAAKTLFSQKGTVTGFLKKAKTTSPAPTKGGQ